MSHVTPATANRMKESGFPQPEPCFGQVWLRPNGKAVTITVVAKNETEFRLIQAHEHDRGVLIDFPGRELSDMTFAPDTADILFELPGYLCGSYERHYFENFPVGYTFFCRTPKGNVYSDFILSETCAAAWLELHEKA